MVGLPAKPPKINHFANRYYSLYSVTSLRGVGASGWVSQKLFTAEEDDESHFLTLAYFTSFWLHFVWI